MKNRLLFLFPGVLFVCLLSLPLEAQFNFMPSPDTIYYLNADCSDTLDFNGMPPTVTSTIGANIVSPPTGVDAALTGYAVGDAINGVTDITIAYVAADDVGNQDTFYYDIHFVDTVPPVFVEPTPADITVACATDITPPGGAPLHAVDACNVMDTLLVFPVDNPPIPPAACGSLPTVITRTWTATDMSGNATTVTQMITILPDTDPPVIGFLPVDSTVSCENANYSLWLSVQQNTILASTSDNCTSGTGYTQSHNGPPTFDTNCGSITVLFTIADQCGLFDTASATYTIIDTVAPVLIGVPADTIVNCSDGIPAPAMVTATDNCLAGPVVTFQENSNQTNTGACSDYSYIITRTWTATDTCGNQSTATQVISVVDLEPPVFSPPADTLLACGAPTDTASTGSLLPSMISDNCSTDFTITFSDAITPQGCSSNYDILRTWTVTDVCNNSSSATQLIMVRDTIAPTFTPPADTLYVDCTEVSNLNITGQPTNLADQCETLINTFYQSDITDIVCANTYTLKRTWYVQDGCLNTDSFLQVIYVQDTLAPAFAQLPQDRTIDCSMDIGQSFSDWLDNLAQAQASDVCTADTLLSWQMENADGSGPASLPTPCSGFPPEIFLTQDVRFIVADECGNADTAVATFTVVDTVAPVFFFLPQDTLLPTDPGLCEATFSLVPPPVTEDCGNQQLALTYNQTQLITAAAGDSLTVIVDPVLFQIPVAALPTQAVTDVTLTIALYNADAEQPTEYFLIYGEDGSLLGQTNLSATQCDSSLTTLTIPVATYNTWAQDGQVDILLEPYDPPFQGGEFSINDICGNSTAQATLTYDATTPDGLTYEYSIDGGARQVLDPNLPPSLSFPQGSSTVTYFVTDCSGNERSVSFQVLVEDQEPPILICPANQTVPTDTGSCTAETELPLFVNVTDNCGLTTMITQTQPDINNAYITFYYDPNLGETLAENFSFLFAGLPPAASGNVTLTIEILGDVDEPGEYFTIVGPFIDTLGTTEIGQPHVTAGDCNNHLTATFTIPAAEFNTWAQSGFIPIVALSNTSFPVPSPPGIGINPCIPGNVYQNGAPDLHSTIQATFEYEVLTPTYFTDGATTIPPTQLSTLLPPVETLNQGVTTVYYVVEDLAGNADTCFYDIEVVDTEPPQAVCGGSIVYINPSGLVTDTISPASIDLGSTDNCAIEQMLVEPNLITCDMIGDTLTVNLIVLDAEANSDTCQALVRVEGEAPQPDYFIGACGSDTLYLFANPPGAPGNNIYLFHWTGPNGFSSTEENPVIYNVTTDDAGTYALTIEGLTGCTSYGEVQVSIDDLPITADMAIDAGMHCYDEDIVLTTTPPPGSASVEYLWFSGLSPNGTLIATTTVPSYTLPAPHMAGDSCYFVIIVRDGCPSNPSASVCTTVIGQPEASVADTLINVCEGDLIQLGTYVSGPDITYQWTGPNGFSSNSQFPMAIEPAAFVHAGIYSLTVFDHGCASSPAMATVNVLDTPDKPLINNSTTQSTPACIGDTVWLTTNITGVTSYLWTSPQFQTFVTDTNILVLENVSLSQAGAWTVQALDNICQSEVSEPTFVYIENLPNVAITSNSPVCNNEQLLLSVDEINGAIYAWTAPDGNSYTGSALSIAPVAGQYSVTITSATGCTNSDVVNIDVLQAPSITAVSSDALECPEGPTDIHLYATLFPPDQNYDFLWSGPDGFVSTDSIGLIPAATSAQNGEYTLIVTDAQGCQSNPASVNVNMGEILPAPDLPQLSEPSPFCDGDMVILNTTDVYSGFSETYYWVTPVGTFTTSSPSLTLTGMDTTYTGSYHVYVEVDGCFTDPSAVVPIEVFPIPEPEIYSDVEVCEGDVISFSTDCMDGEDISFQWTGPAQFNATVCNPIIAPAMTENTGTYVLVVTLNGCTSAPVSTNVVVKPMPDLPLALNNGPICMDDPNAELILQVDPNSATAGASYQWYDSNQLPIGPPTASLLYNITDFSSYSEGSYDFYVVAVLDGCESSFSIPTTVDFSQIPANQADAGPDFFTCEDEPAIMNATPPTVGTGHWELVSGNPNGILIANPDDPHTTVTGLVPGQSYTFRWSLSNGACVDYSWDEVTVTADIMEDAYGGPSIDTCAVGAVQLAAQLPIFGTGYWHQPSSQEDLGIVIADPNDPNTVVSGFVPGNVYIFYWTLPDNGCGESTDQITVQIADQYAIGGMDFFECGNGCVQLSAMEPTVGTGSWLSPNPDITFDDPFDPETVACNLQPGDNVLLWTINGGICGPDATDTLHVEYKYAPVAQDDEITVAFAGRVTVLPLNNDTHPGDITISIIQGPMHGQLTDLGNGVFEYQADINFIGSDEVIYEICSVNCECAQAVMHFAVGGDARCMVPTIITPNGDGINDVFVIPCFAQDGVYPESSVSIINQWGDEVFYAAPYRNDWGGTYNGEDLPAGTYFYIVNFGDGSPPESGFLIIQR